MKKLYTTVMAILVAGAGTVAFGQSQRLVLVEHFTQASCGPCAGQNPTLHSTMQANSTKATILTHQVSWPGVDAMNAIYPAGPEDRRNYYGVTGVPNTVLGGGSPGAPNTVVTTNSINARYGVASPFDIDLSNSALTPAWDGIDVEMTINCTQAVSGNLKAHIAIIEDHITYADAGTPGGTNGETDYYSVMRQMLPNTSGTTIAASWAVNDNSTINESWNFSTNGTVANFGEVAIIAFIQDDVTKEIHQAQYFKPAITAQVANDAAIVDILNVDDAICGTSITPTVTLQSFGSNPLTSVDISYSVNGGTPQVHNWTGNLAFLATDQVNLPAISFTAQASNTVTITAMNPNATTDDEPSNDSDAKVFAAPETAGTLVIELVTDGYGDETYWEVQDAGGNTVDSGGNAQVGLTNIGTNIFPAPTDPGSYASSGTFTENVTLTSSGCHTFYITDYYGDGMCCAWGNGSWTLKDDQGATMATGGEFTDMEQVAFMSATQGLEENELSRSINIYPNPFVDNANISLGLSSDEHVTIEVRDLMGKLIFSEDKGTLSAGNYNYVLNLSDVNAGMYFVNITAGDQTATKKITSVK
jgi:hypothetical protein